jgi:NAD(P)H-dependent flavin oxidoreductase YrpB (nitropropane dioxygenase family)
MAKTRLCQLLGIEVPIILAPMGTCTSAELVAALANEGGLVAFGSLVRPTATVKAKGEWVILNRGRVKRWKPVSRRAGCAR